MQQKQEIAILDFGSQYTHLIARRVRELGVVSHIYSNDARAKELKNAVGVILSGGPRSIVRGEPLKYDPAIFKLGVPILGHCYGHQLIAQFFGGAVEHGGGREYGLAKLAVGHSQIFKGVPKITAVWMSHGDHVAKLPLGFRQIGESGTASIAAMANDRRKIYGFQFHPEVRHSDHGKLMLKNFIFDICKAKKNWSTSAMMDNIEEEIRRQANCHSDRASGRVEESRVVNRPDPSATLRSARDDTKNIFLLVSGGVDSTVCFALLEKVLGKKRVYGLHIDSGFMRLGETKKISTALAKLKFDNLHIYNAEKEFLTALKGVTEPEEKRKIIGNLYLDIADRVMRGKNMSGDTWLLGQGTIYPDTIESGGTKNADIIKTHHNRVPRILQMMREGKIIEPIKELYKDEVRAIGRKLGLPPALINRHPFPGPGLAIRCLCSAGSNEKPKSIVWGKNGIKIVKLPIKSVGVQGDERSYARPAVITDDKLDWKKLRELSPAITNDHPGLNRVLLLIHGAEPDLLTSRVYKSYLTKKRLELLRKIDDIVDTAVLADPRCKHIWQMPTVLIPFGFKHQESIVLRPVESEEAMTVSWARIPHATLQKISKKITALNAVDFIFFDLTNKPPGTIEWE